MRYELDKTRMYVRNARYSLGNNRRLFKTFSYASRAVVPLLTCQLHFCFVGSVSLWRTPIQSRGSARGNCFIYLLTIYVLQQH